MVLDVAEPWNSSIGDNWWRIESNDGMNLLNIIDGVLSATSFVSCRDLISDREWSGHRILRESEVDLHKRSHYFILEPKIGEVDDEESESSGVDEMVELQG